MLVQAVSGARLRAEYRAIRAAEYQREFGFDGSFLLEEDSFDRSGLILAVRDGDGPIVGGARINFSFPESPATLPLEQGGAFVLGDLLPSYSLAHRAYAEISRFAVAAGYQDGRAAKALLHAFDREARERRVPCIFCICPEPQWRLHRIFHLRMKTRRFTVFHGIAVPPQFGIGMNLCLSEEAS